MKYRDKNDIKKIDLKLIKKEKSIFLTKKQEKIIEEHKELKKKILITKDNLEFKIIEYFSFDFIIIEFLETGFQMKTDMRNINNKKLTDRFNKKNYHNVGFIGVGEFKATLKDKSFSVWRNLINRCYDKKDKLYKFYGAKGVTICSSWHNYQNFASWYKKNYIKNFEIDKDLLCDSLNIYPKVYSYKTCKFITKSENIAEKNRRISGYQFNFNNKKYKSLRDCEKDTGISRFSIKKKLKELESIS